ncbi:zinc finger CCCH-type antiviral protein 1 [Takifugu rubripes]|uniref:Zinc finger CCCH-type antiviral protein 1-like n=1 Tax=Takifugu rubripes TaxID=31033 RepID=H2UD64_TAKRU|nr:zinc finger CCCH-type antiviral protein 1-like [Takifugu rubripes]|eukprot:XP_011611639.1 PREDICTED: zinc finger CCCH-type antiviral protein 1-like [Takifugu rubripes]
MATARDSDNSTASESESSEGSDEFSDGQESKVPEPCRYYNDKGCKNRNCTYLHVCKNALTRNPCRPRCTLNHDIEQAIGAAASQQNAQVPMPANGRPFRWQLCNGKSWKNIENDHIIEINYCLPHAKGITIYNTPYGEVRIDFSRMRILKKNLKVRRLDDGRSKWIWYCMLSHKWKSYGHKDAKGNSTPKSEAIESSFQRNRRSSFPFNIGSETFEINFREMKQEGQKKKRSVRRRPVYRPVQQQARGSQGARQNLPLV